MALRATLQVYTVFTGEDFLSEAQGFKQKRGNLFIFPLYLFPWSKWPFLESGGYYLKRNSIPIKNLILAFKVNVGGNTQGRGN